MNSVLLITGLYPKELEQTFLTNSKSNSLQNAPNVFQWALLSGLEENSENYTVHSYPFLASFPIRYKKVLVEGAPIVLNGHIVGESFSYINIIGLKTASIRRNIYRETKKWLLDNSSSENVVIVYSQWSYLIEPLLDLKKRYCFKLCIIVTDLIEDALSFPINRRPFKRIQITLEKKRQRKVFPRIDKFILLSEHMQERIPESVGKSIIVEGMANLDENFDGNTPITSKSIKSLLYTGSLHPFSGIRDLVDAFMMTENETYRLIICGIGTEDNYVVKKQQEDKRIVFLGNVTRNDAVRLQQTSSVLVNPRKPNGAITKYSFPSKTMEYLSSGTPMIGYHLEGIPNDYKPFILSPKDLSVGAMSDIIDRVLSLPAEELKEMGYKAYEFIKTHKTSKIQANRILQFVFDV